MPKQRELGFKIWKRFSISLIVANRMRLCIRKQDDFLGCICAWTLDEVFAKLRCNIDKLNGRFFRAA